MKQLEETYKKCFRKLGWARTFWKKIPKAQTIEIKINQRDNTKLKNFCINSK
jgi:hypothetical protein